jgi:DNA adenine methylase
LKLVRTLRCSSESSPDSESEACDRKLETPSGQRMASITPIFRWAGSKRKVLPILAKYWNPHFSRYIEPFVGSAALFFRLQPQSAVLGDINLGLIEAYEVIRQRPDDVFAAVSKIPRSKHEYYRIRAQNVRQMGDFGRAVRFVYLNRYCFNGIFRTNLKGEFNVPYAHTKPGVIPPIENFRQSAQLLERAKLRCTDFGEILSSVRCGDFVYLDPPYAVESRRVFRQYDRKQFTKKDLSRLADHLQCIDRKGAAFVVSYAECKEARELLSHWKASRIRVRRNVAGFVSARRLANEIVVTNIPKSGEARGI